MSFLEGPEVDAAVAVMAGSGVEARGAVFTRREVVDFILDLAGYVPFIERSLSLLASGGNLGFICADRWLKNRYGGPLRQFVAEKFRLKCFVDMVDTDAFLDRIDTEPLPK